MKHQPTINIHNQDCMEAMAKMEDNAFQLAIIDPPYGIGMDGGKIGKSKSYESKNWDSTTPNIVFFNELFRISENQIVWGANYFCNLLPVTSAWIYWDKMQDGFGGSYSTGELAWTSFHKPMKQIRYKWQGNYCGFPDNITTKTYKNWINIHPTQKPVALYKWLLKNYANEGDKILDTHLGSGSIAIACHDMGFDLEAYEIDQEYHQAALQRLNTHRSQLQMF